MLIVAATGGMASFCMNPSGRYANVHIGIAVGIGLYLLLISLGRISRKWRHSDVRVLSAESRGNKDAVRID